MKRILIVEDNREWHEFYRCFLSEEKFALTCRTSAVEAFNDVRGDEYDLIILDILMDRPGFNGIGFLIRLRTQLHSGTPVIITTVLKKDICKGIKHLGNFSFLHKPFTADELLREVKRYLKT